MKRNRWGEWLQIRDANTLPTEFEEQASLLLPPNNEASTIGYDTVSSPPTPSCSTQLRDPFLPAKPVPNNPPMSILRKEHEGSSYDWAKQQTLSTVMAVAHHKPYPPEIDAEELKNGSSPIFLCCLFSPLYLRPTSALASLSCEACPAL